ncbi:flagellar assembly protein FliH [Virgibacillus oceani]|uniref:Flagellar assembly protein FliH n=1 Tax=Virgibacillus oceani TaxID=1479511 RepID=A0A917H683_9BACI|nr:flagellar assembly protein FliH [Virgibacillus oceani]GGG69039.1 putative flagellar assembly protein FliH [Virgibacillus oceani]
MSDIFSNNPGSLKRKQIKIRPIQLEKQKDATEDSLEEEYASINDKLQLAKKDLQQLEQEKEKMLADTKAVINDEKKNWQDEKQLLTEQAQEKGYNDGFATGKQESLENYQQLIDRANAIIDAATADYHSVLEQSDGKIVDLAIHVSEKIMKQRFSEEPSTFLPIVKAAIKEIKDQSTIVIYLHPANYEFVVKQKEELVQLVDKETKLSIYVKEEMEENSCLIEHPFGEIDASVDTQLLQIRKVLQEIAGES